MSLIGSCFAKINSMDLQALHTYKQKTEQISQERHEAAADLLRCGLECLADAQAEGFSDRALLVEACEYLMEALRLNYRETEAYIGMGYLLWVLGDPLGALPYLQEALELEPQNQDVQTLLLLVAPPPSSCSAVQCFASSSGFCPAQL